MDQTTDKHTSCPWLWHPHGGWSGKQPPDWRRQ